MKLVAQMLLMSLTFLAAEVVIGVEPDGIVNLAFPACKKGGWALDADTSESALTLSWKDSGGQEYSTPIKFYNYPNGTFGAISEIRTKTDAIQCIPSFIPLSAIQKRLPFEGTLEMLPENPESYKGKYSLLDPNGNPTQTLEMGPVGEKGEQVAIVSGTLYLVFPGETPDSGCRMLPDAPGTRLILRPGVIAGGKKLTQGRLVVDLLLQDVAAKDPSGTQRTIRNVLVYKVRTEKGKSVEIVTLAEENEGNEGKQE